jgi:hypothetical protein
MRTYIHAYTNTYVHGAYVYLHAYTSIYRHMYVRRIQTYVRALDIHTYARTYIRKYIREAVYTYVHTDIYVYIP